MVNLNEFVLDDILSVYEHPRGSHLIPKKKILVVLRSSGLNLTNEELEKIALKMANEKSSTESDNNNNITFDTYKKVFMEYVKSSGVNCENKFDSYQLLMQAFKSIDTENKGHIELTHFVNLLKSNGEYMSDDEISRMINLTCISNGNFYYEEYCRNLEYH